MRILMTTDPIGGVWTYTADLVAALSTRGHEILLVSIGGRVGSERLCDIEPVANLELVEDRRKLEWMDDPWDDVAASGESLLRRARRFRPDVVHLNQYAYAALPWEAPTVVVGHSCVMSWWHEVKGEPAPAGQWVRYAREVRAGLRSADVVVAPSRAMFHMLERHHGALPHGRVIHNGRCARHFARTAVDARPPAKRPVVFAAGRLWDEAKNLRTLCAAASLVRWPVRVAGDGDVPRRDNVHALGCLSAGDVARELSEAAIYALPAKYEPFGLSVLEAAMSGCALVLSDIATFRELWDGAAAFVDPDDPAAVAAAVNDLIDHPFRREALATLSRERALEYGVRRMADAYESLYREMLLRDESAPRPAGERGETLAGVNARRN